MAAQMVSAALRSFEELLMKIFSARPDAPAKPVPFVPPHPSAGSGIFHPAHGRLPKIKERPSPSAAGM
jgi:hypothetical protein